MTDRPRQAKWLSQAERDYLEGVLATEARAKEGPNKIRVWQALRLRNVWLLALSIFAANTGGYALAFWVPSMVKSLSGGTDHATLLFSGLFYACGLAGVFVSGQSSDRTGDRKWHCAGGQAATALLLAGSAISGQPFAVVMTWLCFTGFAAYFWPSPFWALPTLTLTASAAASRSASSICAPTWQAGSATIRWGGSGLTATANVNVCSFLPAVICWELSLPVS